MQKEVALRNLWILAVLLMVGACQAKGKKPESGPEYSAVPSKLPSIGHIDFKNLIYPYREAEDHEDHGKWEQIGLSQTIQLADGRRDFPEGDYLLLDSVIYGDLDGDDQEEAVVNLRYGTGGTRPWHYLYVFKEKGGGVELISRFVSGSRADGGLVRTAIRENQLLLDVQDSERRTADCCSLGFIRVAYRLKGGSFEEVPPRIKDSFRSRVYPLNDERPDSVQPSVESNITYIGKYPFFLFTPEGTSVRRVGEDDEYIFELAERIER